MASTSSCRAPRRRSACRSCGCTTRTAAPASSSIAIRSRSTAPNR
jgi:hypothetical protein